MPRGVYDRSKLKNKKTSATPDATEAPKQKRKYTRRTPVGATGPAQAEEKNLAVGVAHQGAGSFDAGFNYHQFSFLTSQLGSLTSIKAQAGSSGQFDGLINKIVLQLNKQFDEKFIEAPKPVAKAAPVKTVETPKNGSETVEKTAIPAPVPFLGTTPAPSAPGAA